jgi:hypothetical protein
MNMMRSLYLFLFSAISLGSMDTAAARPATVEGRDWCEIGLAEGAREWKPLDAPLAVVSVGGLAEAMRLLKKRTILPITSRMAKRLAGRVLPGTGKLYLVRSGIFAQPEARPTQYLLQARDASFRKTLWDSEDRLLVTYTMQMQDARPDIFPAPLIVRLSVAPLRVRSFCESYY